MRKYRADNHSLDEALDLSIDDCIREHILEDFFRTRKDEVKKVTLLDFTFEQRIKLATETVTPPCARQLRVRYACLRQERLRLAAHWHRI